MAIAIAAIAAAMLGSTIEECEHTSTLQPCHGRIWLGSTIEECEPSIGDYGAGSISTLGSTIEECELFYPCMLALCPLR